MKKRLHKIAIVFAAMLILGAQSVAQSHVRSAQKLSLNTPDKGHAQGIYIIPDMSKIYRVSSFKPAGSVVKDGVPQYKALPQGVTVDVYGCDSWGKLRLVKSITSQTTMDPTDKGPLLFKDEEAAVPAGNPANSPGYFVVAWVNKAGKRYSLPVDSINDPTAYFVDFWFEDADYQIKIRFDIFLK